MHPQARHARFSLIVCVVTVALAAAAYFALLATLGPHKARGAFGLFGILGLLGLGPTFYHKKPGEAGIVMDERDWQISCRSQIFAWRIVLLYWCLVCMGPWAWVAIRSGIDAVEKPLLAVEWLPWILMVSGIVYFIAWSLAVLRSYRHEKDPGID